jgi:futalosine hydrolase
VTTLLVVAAPAEVTAVVRGVAMARGERAVDQSVLDGPVHPEWRARKIADGLDLVVTGVGKANAAAAVARAIDPQRHVRALNLGIAGALPGSGLTIGDVVLCDRAAYGDEGSANPGGFVTIGAMGFGPLVGICGPGAGMEEVSIALEPLEWRGASAINVRTGAVASVSTCSGNDGLARAIAARTGAIVEDMEAAAIAFTLARVAPGVRTSAAKVVSNTTGDRAEQTWDVPRALARLREVASVLGAP